MLLESVFEIFRNLIFFALHIGSPNLFPKPLTRAQETEAVEKARNGDINARNLLIEHNLRLVVHIIKKYDSKYNEQEDLISIGTIGLIKGINSYNPDKGVRLATYAARCIENEILMYFRGTKKSSQEVSMNDPIDSDTDGNPLTYSDVICTDDTIVDDLNDKFNKIKLRQFIEKMNSERDKTIIILRYGLNGSEAMTQQEVANILGISRSYVSRIEKRVLTKMKKEFDECD